MPRSRSKKSSSATPTRGCQHPRLPPSRNRKRLLAVVHVEDREQALSNVGIARRAGCDGAFLINHNCSAVQLCEVFRAVHEAYPDYFLGVNVLRTFVLAAH